MSDIIIEAIIKGGAAIFGSHKAASATKDAAKTEAEASTKAAEIEAASAEKARQQAKEIYEQQRADQGPYRESGYGSLNAINFGLGLPETRYQAPVKAAPTVPGAPTTPAAPPSVSDLTTLAAMPLAQANSPNGAFYLPGHGGVFKSSSVQGSGLVKVQSPSGTVHLVPPEKVAEAEANGGKRV